MDRAEPMHQAIHPAAGERRALRVAALADDLIWGTRLESLLRGAGARPVPCRDLRQLERLLAGGDRVDGVVIDMTGRAYDGVAAVALAAAGGRPVLAAARHDDAALRRRALEAGAAHVFPYARLHADGATIVGRWLAGLASVTMSR